MATTADIDNRFSFHPATTDEKRTQHDNARGSCHDLAMFLNAYLPEGREKATALTKLEEVMFWSNAALARALPADAPERTAQPNRV